MKRLLKSVVALIEPDKEKSAAATYLLTHIITCQKRVNDRREKRYAAINGRYGEYMRQKEGIKPWKPAHEVEALGIAGSLRSVHKESTDTGAPSSKSPPAGETLSDEEDIF